MSDQILQSINDHLPEVLLTEVFLYILASSLDNTHRFNNARATLCTVCKYWYDILVGYPNFWSTFRLYPLHQQISLSTIDIWLQRSATSPIGIYINSIYGGAGRWSTAESLQFHRKLLLLFLQHITRWKRLDVCSSSTIIQMFRDLKFTSAHLLEEVNVLVMIGWEDPMLDVFLALEGAPNLASLKYYTGQINLGFTILEDPTAVALLKRLRSLEISTRMEASLALDIIRTGVSAERIRLQPTQMFNEPMIMASSMKLSILELYIHDEKAGAMLAYLHLPNLKFLSVECFQGGGTNVASGLSEFVGNHPGRSLQVLVVDDVVLDALEGIARIHGLSRIPVVVFRRRERGEREIDDFKAILREKLEQWKKIESRFRMCFLLDNDDLVFAYGWVDSRWYEQHRESLRHNIFDKVDIDRLLV